MNRQGFHKLDREQKEVYFWQYELLGGFKTALFKAISLADESNLALLEKAFPVEVNGYRKFSTVEGWWQNVEKIVNS